MIYNPLDQITTIFSAVEELLKFANITGTPYTQDQDANIDYLILHRTGNFGLAIRKWNHMITVQRTWVRFKHFLRTAHQKLR